MVNSDSKKTKAKGLGQELFSIFLSYLKTYFLAFVFFALFFCFYAAVKKYSWFQTISAVLAFLAITIIAVVLFAYIRKKVRPYNRADDHIFSSDGDVIEADFVDVDDGSTSREKVSDVETLINEIKTSRTRILYNLRDLESLSKYRSSSIKKKELEEIVQEQRIELAKIFKSNSKTVSFALMELAKKVLGLSH